MNTACHSNANCKYIHIHPT